MSTNTPADLGIKASRQDAHTSRAKLVGKKFKTKKATYKVMELDEWMKAESYWCQITEGTHDGYEKGDERRMSKTKIEQFINKENNDANEITRIPY